MRNYFLVLTLLLISLCSLFAVPAVPWAVEKVQPDGTKISIFLKGDENVHWMESADGYTLMYDSLKYVVYAQTDVQGNLMPSSIKFGNNTKPNANISKGLRYSKAQTNTLMQIDRMTRSATIQRAATGNIKVLCVLAAFSNRAFVKTTADFDALMNQVGYSTGGTKGSVKDYYLENSYGRMNLQVTVIGIVTVSHPVSYYGETADPTKQRWRTFVNEVINLADPLVDYSQFATNGQVESFHIIFAGYGDEAINNGQQIWSHKWSLSNSVIKDGVRLTNYSCSPELRGSSGSNITYIGVIAHELGHIFGSPDYYDVNGSDYAGSGYWDLMASGSWNDGGRQPAHINSYQKIQFGWIRPQTLVAGSTISNMPPSVNSPTIYKIAANANGEHYLLENRQQIGFDASLPGHGLLIWHIAANVANYAPNDNHPLQVYPVCASSTIAIPTNMPSSYGNINSSGCPFPGTSRKTEFTSNSIPSAFTWTGLAGIGNLITNIVENTNGTISFGSPIITGPDAIASSCQATYAITNLPAGATNGHWMSTGIGLSIIQSNFTGCTVQRVNPVASEEIWYVYTLNQQQFTVTKNIVVGIVPGFSGVRESSPYNPLKFTANVGRPIYFEAGVPLHLQSYIREYQWELTKGGQVYHFSGQITTTSTTFTQGGTYPLRIRVRDGYGWGPWHNASVEVMPSYVKTPPPFIVYSIPTTSILNFELDTTPTPLWQNISSCYARLISVTSGETVLNQPAANFSSNFNIDISSNPTGCIH